MLITKRRTTQTPQGNLSKQEKQWLAEIDWDAMEELDAEEEGQVLPMRDYPSKPQEGSQVSSPSELPEDQKVRQYRRGMPILQQFRK